MFIEYARQPLFVVDVDGHDFDTSSATMSYLPSLPIADNANPCFCPIGGRDGEIYLSSFTQLLERAVDEEGEEYGLGLLQSRRAELVLSRSSTLDSGSLYSFAASGRAAGAKQTQNTLLNASKTSCSVKPSPYTPIEAYPRSHHSSNTLSDEHSFNSSHSSIPSSVVQRTLIDSVRKNTAQHKRKHTYDSDFSSFDDLCGPAKRNKSILDANDASFEVDGRAGRMMKLFTRTRGHSSSSNAHIHVPEPSTATQDQRTIRELRARVRSLEGAFPRIHARPATDPTPQTSFTARMSAPSRPAGLVRLSVASMHCYLASASNASSPVSAAT